jgi:hypothetical protein
MLDYFTISSTTPATAVTEVSAPVYGLDKFSEIKVVAALVGATGGTLDVYLQWTPDGGTTWFDYAHYPQLASAAAAVKYSASSSFGAATTPTVVGKGSLATPAVALAVNTFLGGPFGNGLRAVYVAGASTTVGAAVAITIFGVRK